MATQYFCKSENRRLAVSKHATLNGIDYLEVLDHDAPKGPPPSPPQQTLLVHCFKALPAFTKDNVRIDGGVRVTSVKVVWAFPVSSVPASLLTPQEQALFAALPQPDQVLLVRTDSPGDFSTYQISLVQGPTTPKPPTDFDPHLSEVEFSFKVECPSDFDCQPEAVCPPERLEAPPIDYLAKDFASFRRLMLDRLAVTMPDWQERSPADLGIVLVEVLAYAADHLSYYQDAVATEAYLGTARKRVSVRRHARLLDYMMHDGCNARAWVCVEVNADGVPLQKEDVNHFPTRLLTQCAQPVVLADAQVQRVLETLHPEVFEPLHNLVLYQAHNAISFYTWSESLCCLPKGATRATLRDDQNNRLRLIPGDILIFEERLGTDTGKEPDADPTHRQAVRLTSVSPEAQVSPTDGQRIPGGMITDPLTNQPIVEIAWEEQDALAFPLCLSTKVAGTEKEDVSIARGNVVLADHGRTLAYENLLPPQVPETGRYRPYLQQSDITSSASYDPTLPATVSLIQDPRAALPAVKLGAPGGGWAARRDLLGSDRFARDFVVEMESDGRAQLRFGDDVLGRRPAGGAEFKATYRVGNGRAGNVGAEAIAHIVTSQSGITRVRNPLSARGGMEPETSEQVRLYAPQAFRTQKRAVTEDDYAEVAQRQHDVQKAAATLRWTGSWYTMFITVDRKGGRAVDPAFRADLRAFLETYRLAGYDVEIDAPRFVPLEIAFTVCVAPGYFQSMVQKALLTTFSKSDLPDGRRGFFHPDNFTFGQPVYLSQVVAAAMQTPGVLWVDTDDTPPKPNRFQRWGQAPRGEIAQGRITFERLEIARLENDPNAPENGKIEFFFQGGL